MMTDKQIVKALECCVKTLDNDFDYSQCIGCAFETQGICCENATEGIAKAALNVINCQKAEIERLRKRIETVSNNPAIAVTFNIDQREEIAGYIELKVKKIKIEAIKEFVEKLKAAPIAYDIPLFGLSTKNEIIDYCNNIMGQVRDAIDSLVEEMAGAANEKT